MNLDPIKSAISGICSSVLDAVVNVYKSMLATNRDEKIGALKQNDINRQAQVNADDKEISDLRSQKDFSDRVYSNPDELERMRVSLNDDIAGSAPPKK